MDDVISRQAAIDAMLGDKVQITDTIRALGGERDFEVLNYTCDRHAEIIKDLPPVQPKRGKWITEPIEDPEYCRCSECGYTNLVVEVFSFNGYNFCPNCGADMQGDKDGRS